MLSGTNTPANSSAIPFIYPHSPRVVLIMPTRSPAAFLVVLWGGMGVQYSAHNPGVHIRNASDIQTLGIIAGKKKAPVTGPQFIVGLC